MRSGFVCVLGRPNVGKSTLVNRLVGEKVSIVSRHPGTTRTAVRGIYSAGADQVVFVDTPGLQAPVRVAGRAMNQAATTAARDVDLALVVIDGQRPLSRGDRRVLSLVAGEHSPEGGVPWMVVLNKADRSSPEQLLATLATLESEGLAGVAQWPISALTGVGVAAMMKDVVARMPEGPQWYPAEMKRDQEDHVFVAELVREQLLRHLREELPHSVACRVTQWSGRRITCEIVVERDSQKGIVIGAHGALLAEVGRAVRKQLSEGTYLELLVKVEPRWPDRAELLPELGIGPQPD